MVSDSCEMVYTRLSRSFLTVVLVCMVGCESSEEVATPAGQFAPSFDPEVLFVDVTEAAGIDFTHTNAQSGRKHIVETVGSGAAFLDWDSDGHLDLYIVNGADLPGYESPQEPRNSLYHNRGDGTFGDNAATLGVDDTSYGMGCVVGDYDNDGDSDLFVANYGTNKLYRNNLTPSQDPAAAFTDVAGKSVVGATNEFSTGAAMADYDLDGDLDLFVATYLRYEPGDDALDDVGDIAKARRFLAPTEYSGAPNHLYRNDGDDRFADVTRSSHLFTSAGRPLGALFFDYDDDGDPDLFLANDATPNFLYRNDGSRFVEVGLSVGVAYGDGGVPEGSMGVDVQDVNGDGHLDLALTNFQWESNRLHTATGDGHFRDASRSSGLHGTSLDRLAFGINFFDADNDGDRDLFIANGHIDEDIERFDPSAGYAQRDQLFLNDGRGAFTDISYRAGPYFAESLVGRGSATGDYDNDGDVDLFIVNSNDRAVLLRNELAGGANWVALDLHGSRGNRDGIGACVEVVTGELVQRTQVKSATSYLSQNDPRLHFGLGRHERVDAIRVRWSSGIEQELHDLKVNRIHAVREPDVEPPPRAKPEADATAYEPRVKLMHLLAWAPLSILGQDTEADDPSAIPPPSPEEVDSLRAVTDAVLATADDLQQFGEALRLNRRSAEARAQFKLALARDRKHVPSHISLGKLELTMGRAQQAAGHFGQAARLAPDDGKPLSLLGYLAVRAQSFDRAINYYEAALSRDPTLTGVYANLARAYERQANPAEALITLRRGLKVEPDDVDMRLYLADIYLSRGQQELAEEQLEGMLELDPERTEALALMSTVTRLRGDVDAAIELLEEAVQGDSTDVGLQSQLGLLRLEHGEPRRAVPHLEMVISHDPDTPEVCYALANAYRELGDHASAQVMLRYFAHLRNHYREIVAHRSAVSLNRGDAESLFELGKLYTHLGRLEGARQAFAYSLKIEPENIDALAEIGGIYLRRRDLSQAIATFAEVLARDSTHVKAWELLGSALMLSGDQTRAQPALERAIQLDENLRDAHAALAQIHQMSGHEDKASWYLTNYRRLAANLPPPDDHRHSDQEAAQRPARLTRPRAAVRSP